MERIFGWVDVTQSSKLLPTLNVVNNETSRKVVEGGRSPTTQIHYKESLGWLNIL